MSQNFAFVYKSFVKHLAIRHRLLIKALCSGTMGEGKKRTKRI